MRPRLRPESARGGPQNIDSARDGLRPRRCQSKTRHVIARLSGSRATSLRKRARRRQNRSNLCINCCRRGIGSHFGSRLVCARVFAIDRTLVGDYDERRRRVRLRASTCEELEAALHVREGDRVLVPESGGAPSAACRADQRGSARQRVWAVTLQVCRAFRRACRGRPRPVLPVPRGRRSGSFRRGA